MSCALAMPTEEEIGEFFTNLLGLQVESTKAAAFDASRTQAAACYVDEGAILKAIIACDIECAAKLGASLTQVPMGGVEDAIDAGTLPENLAANLAEVFNISTNVFREAQSHRLVVDRTEMGDGATKVLRELNAGGSTTAYEIDIARYGTGLFSITTLDA